jgi:hypothetical protein
VANLGNSGKGEKFVFFASALNLTFSPGEKEQQLYISGFAMIIRPIQSQVFESDGE